VRTLSAAAEAFNPVAYHLGTVWPHDNGLIVAGLRRYGHDEEAHRIYRGIFEAASHFDLYRLPEVFAGFPADPYGEPVRYPVACHPQAWAAGSLPFLLTTMLGLEADGFRGRLRIVRPRLLDLVEHLAVEDLRVGEGSVDLRFRRQGGRVEVEVIPRHGTLEVEVDYDG
jgi:glycogen debranching enzyme